MDKQISSITAPITFVDGESLTAAKLNAAFRNLYRGISALEALIGDPHDSAAPYGDVEKLSQGTYSESGNQVVAPKDLNIVNIARLIGPAEALNPRHLIKSSYQITETLPSNVTKLKLKYRNLKSIVSCNDSSLTNLIALPSMLMNPRGTGDYWIDRDAGVLHCITPTNGDEISYDIDEDSVDQLENYYEASFNVIPDPNQTVKCFVSLVDPGIPSYLLTLPYVLNQQSNDHDDGNEIVQQNGDLNYGTQLKLPLVLRGLTAGDVIPPNFLVVKNLNTNRYLSGVVYKYATAMTLTIEGAVLDIGDDYQVVTVGTSITETIKDINKKLTALRMGREGRDLILASKIVNDIEGFANSKDSGNVLPQYLNRGGATNNEYTTLDQGGMRGPLLICSTTKNGDETYAHLEENSQPIYFGNLTGPSIDYLTAGLGAPSMNHLRLDPGSDASSVRVVNGFMGAEDGVMAGAGAVNGPFKWAKLTYNSALTGAGTNEISIDVLGELDIVASQIISITGGLWLSGATDLFIPIGQSTNDGMHVYELVFTSSGSFGAVDSNGLFEIGLGAAAALVYTAVSSGNRKFKLFVHYED